MIIQSANNNFSEIQVIGFDADDTLWENEDIFLNAQKEFKDILKNYSSNFDEELLKIEKENLDKYGYGVKGFILSLIETSIYVSENKIDSESIEKILRLGKEMLSSPVTLIDGVKETLEILSKEYQLILITKGDLLDQERKIKNSKLFEYFDYIEIISEKNEESYLDILQKKNINPRNFLMVGNSLKSDISPVINIGGKAIYIPYKLTWANEVVKNADLPRGYLHLEKISFIHSHLNKLTRLEDSDISY